MAQREISILVHDYVMHQNSGESAGASGSDRAARLRLEFDSSWAGTTKTVYFTDAQGSSSSAKTLGLDDLAEGEEETYEVTIPASALAYPGRATVTVRGIVLDAEGETERVITTAAIDLRVLDSRLPETVGELGQVDATAAEQLQAEIDGLKATFLDAVEKTQASETNAKASEEAAKTSETNAKTSETKAQISWAQAAANAANAATSAENAKTSETNAKQSEESAATSAAAAATSEANAKASEESAQASEEAAKASQDAAQASEAAAKESQTAAEQASQTAAEKASQEAAENVREAMEASQTAAATSEANAKASATAAAESAAAAATSKANAETSETNAATSATNAAESEARVILIEDAAQQREPERQYAEEERQRQETERKNAETQRQSAETQRQSAETQRQSAEQARNVWEDYAAETTYVAGNKVYYEGSSYVCTATTTGHAPTEDAYWQMIAKKGEGGGGAGDMPAETYDPQGKKTDIFAYTDNAAEDKLNRDLSNMITEPKWSTETVSARNGGLCYGNGMFVVADKDNAVTVCYSTDGVSWSETTDTVHAYGICYGNGMFVAAGYNQFYYSTDGISWTAGDALSGTWKSVCYGNGMFLAAGYGRFACSTDGITWKLTASMPADSYMWNEVCYGAGMFLAVGESSGKCAYSVDGVNWTYAAMPAKKYASVCYGAGKFWAVRSVESTYIDCSADGVNWESVTQPVNISFSKVRYEGGWLVAVSSSSSGSVIYSKDGVNWETEILFPANALCYGNGMFLAVKENGGAVARFKSEDTTLAEQIGAQLDEQLSTRLDGLGAARIQAKTYTGWGTYGSANERSLTFDFVPKVVLIQNKSSKAYHMTAITGSGRAISNESKDYEVLLTWSGKTFSWFSNYGADAQLNSSGTTYAVVAIG